MRTSSSRTLLTMALAGMAVAAVAGPAAAHEGEGDRHRGKVGRHRFPDSKLKPGARCVYREAEPVPDAAIRFVKAQLVEVSVRPPKVAAINRSDRVDRQPVAWRFVLHERVRVGEKLVEGEWTKVKRSALQIRRTNEKRAADFSRMAIRYDGNPDAEYRVKTKAYWLRNRRPWKAVGAASHLVGTYRVRGELTTGSCPGGVPAPEIR